MDKSSNRRFRRGAVGGFTLLEILLVLAIIGLFSGIFIANMNLLFTFRDEKSTEEVFEEAVRQARFLSAKDKAPVQLLFDEELPGFRLKQGGEFIDFPVREREERYEVRFLQERSRDSFILIQGQLVETEPIDRVVFFPDGSCTPFLVEFGSGAEAFTVRIDPWTGVRLPPEGD